MTKQPLHEDNEVLFNEDTIGRQSDKSFWENIERIDELAKTMQENGDRYGLHMVLRDPRDNKKKQINNLILKPVKKKIS